MIEQAVLYFVVSLLAAAIGAYVGTYLREKGKNLATHEDIDRVVRATEDVKAQISGDLWEKQNRWTFKRDVYVRLLENLGTAHRALSHLYDAETVYSGNPQSEARKKWLADLQEKRTRALEETSRVAAVGSVILNAGAVTILDKLEAELAKASNAETYFEYIEDEVSAVKEAYDTLRSAAKADLVLDRRV